MIKIWPDSLDINTPQPAGSFLFVGDLITYAPNYFIMASSLEDADCVMIPQFSNNGIVEYKFDSVKADRIAKLKKKIVLQNDGGGLVKEGWWASEIGEYIWNDYSELIKVFFSVECYNWHRELLPSGIKYVPYDFIGKWEVPPMQTKEQYLRRTYDTSIVMNVYPPTRDKLWELATEGHWRSFHFRTNYSYEKPINRISWKEMVGGIEKSKITFSPDGATSKTERHVFAPPFSLMMMQDDTVEFPYEWKDGVNCLKMVHDLTHDEGVHINGHDIRVLNKEKTKQKVLEWLDKPDELYQIYCNGYENAKCYQLPYYFKNHIGYTIKEYL